MMSWPADFPMVLTQTDGATLQSHPLYLPAKAGDATAAAHLVKKLVSAEAAGELYRQFPSALLAFVHAEEASGRNALPATYAAQLSELGGLEISDAILQANRPQRTGAPSGYRMAARVEFSGIVLARRDYILVDDFITQGGTLADLRDYIATNGGQVVAATTLAAAAPAQGNDARQLAVLPENLIALEHKFGKLHLERLLAKYGIHSGHHAALANSEATWLLRYPSADHADRAIASAIEQTLARRVGRSAH